MEEEEKDDERKNTAVTMGCSKKKLHYQTDKHSTQSTRNEQTKFTEECYDKKK